MLLNDLIHHWTWAGPPPGWKPGGDDDDEEDEAGPSMPATHGTARADEEAGAVRRGPMMPMLPEVLCAAVLGVGEESVACSRVCRCTCVVTSDQCMTLRRAGTGRRSAQAESGDGQGRLAACRHRGGGGGGRSIGACHARAGTFASRPGCQPFPSSHASLRAAPRSARGAPRAAFAPPQRCQLPRSSLLLHARACGARRVGA